MLRKRIVSIVMVLIMCITLLPQSMPAVEAASNMEGGFEGQEADVYTALGFDTSVKPEGYDPNTTDNPYGKKKFTGNQVFEAMITGPDGAAVYGKNNNGHSTTDISGYPSSTNKNGLGMSAAASADFDGDGLPGEVVYVGIETNKTLTGEKLYLVTGDAKSVKFGSKKQIGKITPQSVAGEKHSWFDYAWQNLLQVTAGDYDGDGYAEIAVYVAENGNARVEVYKCRRTSDSATDCWMDMGNWVRVWSHVLSNTAGEVPNMVSLVSGDFNRDGIDDMAVSSGRFIPSTQSTGRGKVSAICEKSTATVLWGDDADMLQKDSPIDLNEKELGEQVRVSLITGDLDGDGYAELIATGQPVLDAQDYDFAAPRTG
ncbi:MAG: VCBS repeat-containing protein, partial [Lachnospiraceae bacterium]|nr:VCBS repeat-containing protein [Lachnospiraceae bacterium]